MRSLASVVHRRAAIVLVAVLLAAVGAVVYGSGVQEALDPYGFEDPAEERVRADRLIERATGVDPEPQIVVLVRRGRVDNPAVRRYVRQIQRTIAEDPAIAQVRSGYDPQLPEAVSADRKAIYLLAFTKVIDEKAQQEAAVRLRASVGTMPGVTIGGEAAANAEIEQTIEDDLTRAELVAFPLILVLSLLFFRSVAAALLPPLVGILTIIATLALLRAASEAMSLSVFALNLVTGLGLGLAIDYTLLMVSRHRESLAEHGPGPRALTATLQTAGRTVLFSALTVAAALASLMVFPQRFLFSMGVGGVLVPLLAAGTALVVLPAVLTLLGRRIDAGATAAMRQAAARDAQPGAHTGWHRLASLVMRRPLIAALASATVLLLAAAPALQARFTQFDARVLPPSSDSRAVAEALRDDFPGGQPSPILVVARTTDTGAVRQLADDIAGLDGVARRPAIRRLDERLWLLDARSTLDPLSDRAQELVRAIRARPAPMPILVGGESAAQIDQRDSIGDHAPLAALILGAATLLVLLLMTGAPVIAAKQLVMNTLVVGAAFGISVFVFQDGRLEGLLGYESQGALELAQPVLIVALVFGLSTDYGVILLARIMEARRNGASDPDAIATGMERTGRIVTAAAVLFCVAIGATATSQISYIKQLAVAVVIAVIIDAFVVRALLVPSLMRLLGRWNWWGPAWLQRITAWTHPPDIGHQPATGTDAQPPPQRRPSTNC